MLEKTLSRGDYPYAMIWSPDSRHLAIKGLDSGNLQIYDTSTPNARARTLAEGVGPASLAWSRDGGLIAVNQSSPISMLRLLNVADGREVGRRSVSGRPALEGCPFQGHSMAFAIDDRSLWVTCGQDGRTTDFPLALKFSVPDLVAEDRIAVSPPVTGERARSFIYLWTSGHNTLLLSAIVYSVTSIPEPPSFKQRFFAYAFDVERKTELFKPFELADDNRSGQFRKPQALYLIPGTTTAIVRLLSGWTEAVGMPNKPEFDRLFESYNTRSGHRLSTHFGDDKQSRPDSGAIAAAVLLPGGKAMVGHWTREAPRRGGLIVFDPLTGSILQRIQIQRSGPHLAVSPNGQWLASATLDGEIQIYRITE